MITDDFEEKMFEICNVDESVFTICTYIQPRRLPPFIMDKPRGAW